MSQSNGLIRKRYLDSVAYLLALVLFFLPFVELRLGDELGALESFQPELSATGFELIKSKPSTTVSFDTEGMALAKPQNFVWLLAMLSGLLGLGALILSLMNFRNRGLITSMVGLLAVISMAALFLHFRNLYGTSDPTMADLSIKMVFTAWYYLSLIFLLLGAVMSFSQRNLTPHDDQPIPRKAPQLDLENPGDQSEFPRSASESEIG